MTFADPAVNLLEIETQFRYQVTGRDCGIQWITLQRIVGVAKCLNNAEMTENGGPKTDDKS